MFAKKSIGEDYLCLKQWPENTFTQCGEKGVVFTKKGNYKTAFFEAFPKQPATFIRGEGLTIEEAEEKAFSKYLRYIQCDEHDFKRKDNSEHGICVNCSLFLTDIFPPVNKCSVCDKEHVNYFTHEDEYCCKEHFMEKTKYLYEQYSLENIDFIKSEKVKKNQDMFSIFELNIYSVQCYQYLNLLDKFNLYQKNIEEYKLKKDIEKEQEHFKLFVSNKIKEVIQKYNIKKEGSLPITLISLFSLKDFVLLDKILEENLFKDFKGIEVENYENYLYKIITFILSSKIDEID